LFVVDLDGTLLTSEKRIAPIDLTALFRLRQMGFLVAAATGRSNHSFELLMEKLGYGQGDTLFPVDYVIFSTGAGILDYRGNRLLKKNSLSSLDVCSAAAYLDNAGLDFMIHRPVPDTRYFHYSHNGSENPDFYRRLEMYQDFATLLTPEALLNFGEATEIICIVPGHNDLDGTHGNNGHEVAAAIADACRQCNVIKATSPLDGQSMWIEIFPPTVSKSQAVSWLADSIGLQQNLVCAVGNDYNDEDLLHWSGQSFIVANGPPSLKALFQSVASNDNGGVNEAVSRWLSAL
jgi:hydroxymethylpyrimidine pyrophosphatase-like HAD family hydrolase